MFGLSNSSVYAIRALRCLAFCIGPLRKREELAACANVPRPYLAKILHSLRDLGFVTSKRGFTGGYGLARPPHKISLLEVIEGIEHLHGETGCRLGLGDCTEQNPCKFDRAWGRARDAFYSAAREITIADLGDPESLPPALEPGSPDCRETDGECCGWSEHRDSQVGDER